MIEQILEDRGNKYGDFAEHARLTQEMKDTMRSGSNWEECSDAQMEGLDMIVHKIARMINGDTTYMDNIIDIIGYATRIKEDMELDNEEASEIDNLIEPMDAWQI